MSQNQYRIRLYGQTSKDPWKFCENLASILGIKKHEARELVGACPVVIAERLERGRGEALLETIRYLGGLCILEPMSGQMGSEETYQAFKGGLLTPDNDVWDQPSNSARLSLRRLGVVAAAAIFVFVVGTLVLKGSYTNPAPTGLRVVAAPVESLDRNARATKAMALDQLWNNYDELLDHTDWLREQYKRTKDELQTASSTYPYPNRATLREMKRKAMIAKEELDYNLRRINTIERKIRSMEFMESKSARGKKAVTRTAWNG